MADARTNHVAFPSAFRASAERNAVRGLRTDQQAYFSDAGDDLSADGILAQVADAFDAVAPALAMSHLHPLSAMSVVEGIMSHSPDVGQSERALQACLAFVREELLWLAAEAGELATDEARAALSALEWARSGSVVTDAAADALFFGKLADAGSA